MSSSRRSARLKKRHVSSVTGDNEVEKKSKKSKTAVKKKKKEKKKEKKKTEAAASAAAAAAAAAAVPLPYEAGLTRCEWCKPATKEASHPDTILYVKYHDEEWGKPVFLGDGDGVDDELFEFLTLEGAQAGLSWLTILKKRDGYRHAFERFDVEKVSAFTDADVERLVQDPAIVRHRGKITSTVNNAQRVLELQAEFGSFAEYWKSFLPGGQPIVNRFRVLGELPAKTELSTAISKDLKKRGFRFVGPTTVYAFMQATGMVNDHVAGCFLHPDNAE